MSIWAIADLHASVTDSATGLPSKPMDIFGEVWNDHVSKLERAWNDRVSATDTVIIAGDIDWALRLEEATETLLRLNSWSGRKILIRGNHDYWWSSKTTSKVRRSLPPTLSLLHNESVLVDGYNICGSKGSPVPGALDWTPEHEKILQRETHRLRVSLSCRDPDSPTIVALHYPPFYGDEGKSPYRDLLEAHQVQVCAYGHLHGEGARLGPSGFIGGVKYSLVAGDAIDFRPVLLYASE